ncbi:MAG: sulfatase/phosphatase domain-containing protein, partial [Gemmataceae bacterium]
GGTRAASFWRWPGTLTPADCDRLTAHIDFFPTLAALAGQKPTDELAKQVEGRNLLPLLQDPKAAWDERTLFTHVGRWPKDAKVGDYKYAGCSVRTKRWHLVSAGTGKGGKKAWELYDVAADLGEKTDVAGKNADVVKALDAEYDAWWASLPPYLVNEDAVPPKENPYKTLFEKQFGKK